MGEVGLEPTKAKPADLQSAPFAARDTPPIHRRKAADENASGKPRRDRLALSCAAPRPVNCKMLRGAGGPSQLSRHAPSASAASVNGTPTRA